MALGRSWVKATLNSLRIEAHVGGGITTGGSVRCRGWRFRDGSWGGLGQGLCIGLQVMHWFTSYALVYKLCIGFRSGVMHWFTSYALVYAIAPHIVGGYALVYVIAPHIDASAMGVISHIDTQIDSPGHDI